MIRAKPAGRKPAEKPRGRVGRPPANQSGEVDARILDTAVELFLSRGFEGASCEQVASDAGCGKASIYARYADKGELFAAAIRHKVVSAPAVVVEHPAKRRLDARLVALCTAVLEQSLEPDAVRLTRLLIAEAPRFPELVTHAERLGRDRAVSRIAALLTDGKSDVGTVDRSTAAAAKILDIALAPLTLRALLGEPLDVVRSRIGASAEEAVRVVRAIGTGS